MIRHIVFCKFKPEASEETIAEFIHECDKLPSINQEIKNWVSGKSTEPRFHSGDFDWALSCDLTDWDAMDRYMWHEAHLRMGPWAQAAIEFLQSFDFELEYEAPTEFPPQAVTPEPEAAPGGQIRVPPIRGRSVEDARELIAAAGLVTDQKVETMLGGVWAPGRVMGSSPEAGECVPEGSTVELIVTGEWWSKPDFTEL
ncbi:MAG: PASTA domain-containing protein [Gammaproteobacteria bacterium]|jgi:hypothetical protein|nr:PASTA domain-containing protein [Gammaproteobacteria bacterium]MBT4493377.1 PASTA domain-containing protein [Gammaproteobacteria bacterium]MBT7371240.1 PASTA domain-containing protein [Gammaproteobacteria bacterium]